MSNNRLSPPETCRDFAALLPLASHSSLAPEVSVRLRAHVANCARCRAELATYERLDALLTREFAARERRAPFLSREELRQVLTGRRFRLARAQVSDEFADVYIESGQFDADLFPPHRSRPARPLRRALSLVAALTTVLALSIAALGLFHMLRSSATGGILARDLSQVHLNNLAMVSANEGWAIGNDSANANHGVILHYLNGQWSQIGAPLSAGALSGISMLSASDGWIVGAQGLILHYDGQSWQAVQSPVTTALGSISMLSSDEGWAAGNDILHYSHGIWTRVASAPDFIYQLQMLSTTEGWAVSSTHLLHYDNGTWTPTNVRTSSLGAHMKAPPNYPFVQPQALSLSMLSATNGWAVGLSQENMLHYQQGQWQLVQSPNPAANLQAVAMVSANEGWAMGTAGPDNQNVIYHYLNGQWSSVVSPTPQPMTRIMMLSPDEGWAVGASTTILHYLHGTWNVAFSG